MKEVTDAEDLVESLLSAGDRLVIVDFFSPGCGGCKALHPQICQIVEMNPDVLFLQIKKFKDALAKHSSERCSLGSTKGLEEKELVALASNKDLSFVYTPKSLPALDTEHAGVVIELVRSALKLDLPLRSATPRSLQGLNPDSLVITGR